MRAGGGGGRRRRLRRQQAGAARLAQLRGRGQRMSSQGARRQPAHRSAHSGSSLRASWAADARLESMMAWKRRIGRRQRQQSDCQPALTGPGRAEGCLLASAQASTPRTTHRGRLAGSGRRAGPLAAAERGRSGCRSPGKGAQPSVHLLRAVWAAAAARRRQLLLQMHSVCMQETTADSRACASGSRCCAPRAWPQPTQTATRPAVCPAWLPWFVPRCSRHAMLSRKVP